MQQFLQYIDEYLLFCKEQKRLDVKTVKAYGIDLRQFETHFWGYSDTEDTMQTYIAHLHEHYQPKTAKRKLASLKAFTSYLKSQKNMTEDIFCHTVTKFREPRTLPKTIPLHNIQILLQTIYQISEEVKTPMQKFRSLRDIAVAELLLGTGMRISELCALKCVDVDLISGSVLIYGKGAKERILSIENEILLTALHNYRRALPHQYLHTRYFFTGNSGQCLSDQSVRQMFKKYSKLANIHQNITPHMFRHSFATLLLEQDVDIRYIQKLLGHSSISITEIYTYVSCAKQREILQHKNPRNLISLEHQNLFGPSVD